MKFAAGVAFFFTLTPCSGFAPMSRFSWARNMPSVSSKSLKMSSSSRIEGNQRDPTEEELAIMDEMITKLADAKPYDLPNAVRRAFRVCSSPQFFMRIAARADEATNDEKEKLSALASNLVATLDAVVSTTEDQLDERAKEVQNVVTAAAEPDGEFLVPLSAERIQSMQDEVAKLDPAIIDEGFLSTVDAWMNKSHQDGLDGMVGILQKLLQMVAGLQVSRARAAQDIEETAEAALFESLLKTDTDAWDAAIKAGIADGVSATDLANEAQRTMESVVLSLENGSMQQQVMAEYLRELVTRIKALQTSGK
jgi:predicted transcriptional regulator